MKKIFLLLLIFAPFFIAHSNYANAARSSECISVKPIIDTFFIENSQFEEPPQKLNETIKEDKGCNHFRECHQFLLKQHRIGEGKGTTIAIRKFGSLQPCKKKTNSSNWKPMQSDTAQYEKLTLFFPAFLNDDETKRTFTKNEFTGFISSASAVWLRGGYFGVIQDGIVTVNRVDADSLEVKIQLRYDKLGTSEDYKSSPDQIIKEKYIIKRKNIQDLTPWEGKAGKELEDESYRPTP